MLRVTVEDVAGEIDLIVICSKFSQSNAAVGTLSFEIDVVNNNAVPLLLKS